MNSNSSHSETAPDDSDLFGEREKLRAIEAAHERQLQKARDRAERLAAEAAEATEDGIRDLVDEDAEADAAIAAGVVRQLSAQVMQAAKRVRELEQRGDALAFGHTTNQEDERWYIGRQSVIDGDDVLLVDWRAEVAVPFYRATVGDPLGLKRRRHFHYADRPSEDGEAADSPHELVDYSDELLAIGDVSESESRNLRGEAALLAALSEPTQEHMRSAVATIQGEQDAVIRASPKQPLIVQGGPGTGKTVVALHRAAYLLYNARDELSHTGVLLIGPSVAFLNYIKRVLPSLGETGVVAITPAELFPGVRRGHVESDEVADLKGDRRMAQFLAASVQVRQRRPQQKLEVWYGSTKVTVPVERLVSVFQLARRTQGHNEGANVHAELIVEALLQEIYHPSFDDGEDASASFASSTAVREYLIGHWPSLTPTQLLNDLFGSKALLRAASECSELSAEEAQLLFRPRDSEVELAGRRWSNADMPLLDEAYSLLEGSIGEEVSSDRTLERDAATEFEQAVHEDSRVDLAGFIVEDDVEGAELAAATQLGLDDSAYDAAEQDWDQRSDSAKLKPHPKFQEMLERKRRAEFG